MTPEPARLIKTIAGTTARGSRRPVYFGVAPEHDWPTPRASWGSLICVRVTETGWRAQEAFRQPFPPSLPALLSTPLVEPPTLASGDPSLFILCGAPSHLPLLSKAFGSTPSGIHSLFSPQRKQRKKWNAISLIQEEAVENVPWYSLQVFCSHGLASAEPGSCGSVILSCLTLCNPMDCSTQASLSITHSRSLLKLMSIESVMPSNHLILCHPLLLLPSIFPSIRVFSNESAGSSKRLMAGVFGLHSRLEPKDQGLNTQLLGMRLP